MSYTALPSGSIGSLKAIIHSLWSTIKDNFDSHSSRINALEAGVIPTGSIANFGAGSAPTGWLLCDGSAVSRTTYADLFSIIGTTWNTGGEAGTDFRLPDYRGRAAMGKGTGTGLTARTFAAAVGAETVAMAQANNPAHTHSISEGSTHSHGSVLIIQGGGGSTHYHQGGNGTTQSPNQYTNYAATGVTINNQGSGTAHANMQPWGCSAFIIKT